MKRLSIASLPFLLLAATATGQWLEAVIPLDSGLWSAALFCNHTANKVYVPQVVSEPPPRRYIDVRVIDATNNALGRTIEQGFHVLWPVATGKTYGPWADSLAIIDGTLDSVTGFVNTGLLVARAVYDSACGKLYATGYGSSSLVVVDARADTVVCVISVSPSAQVLGHDATGLKVYCLAGSEELVVIDAAADTVLRRISVGRALSGLACLSPGRNALYVQADSDLAVVDCSTDTVRGFVAGTGAAYVLRSAAHARKLYAVRANDSVVAVVDCTSDSVVARIPMGGRVNDLCYFDACNRLYCSLSDGEVAVIDCRSDVVLTTIQVGAYAGAMTLNPRHGRVYVAAYPNSVAVIRDTSTALAREADAWERAARGPTVVRGALSAAGPPQDGRRTLFSDDGRAVMPLHPGPNDVRHLPPGVYFIRTEELLAGDSRRTTTQKVVITR